MTTSSTLIPAGEALAQIKAVLDQIDPDRSKLDASDRLGWVRAARQVRSRLDALTSVLTAEADQAKASETEAGTALVSWLGMGETLSRREAAGALKQARRLGEHPLVSQAAINGKVGTGQARAITNMLDSLAPQLDTAQQAQAEQLLVELAGHMDADQLSKSAGQVLAQVAPAEADELHEQRLQREAEAAHRNRSLRFFRDGNGSVRFDGSLPRVAAEAWMAQLDAIGATQRRNAIQARDRLADLPTPEQRRADALIAMIHTGAERKTGGAGVSAPTARMLVKLDYDKLAAGAAGAGLIGEDDQPLSAGDLRRVCCDAELIPVVLGSNSEVLDVGRAARLVTPALRAALIARDGGCTFPGCDAPWWRCEAHHVVPWWAGGRTELSNLVLQCVGDHPRVEPAKFGIRDQWQVRIAADGLPEFIPPKRLDPDQKPIRHQRHTRPADRPDPRAGPPTAA